jgi:deoxyhypusine synthase
MDIVMPKKLKPLDLSKIKTYSLSGRPSRVSTANFARPVQKGLSFKDFLDGLPGILAGSDLKSVISAMSAAAGNKKTIILGMGAHVTKVGLNPVVIDLMERGIITCVAMNGAGIIHDAELALAGQTSEDVAAAIDDGSFGMAEDTAGFLSDALAESQQDSEGLGQAIGRAIQDKKLPFSRQSILAAGYRLGIPITVHVAIGTDITHMHPQFDAARTGIATHRDFRLFSSVVATLEQGVYLNVGSAVILPEIFLKAVAVARNLGHTLDQFTTVNLDMIRHYRPLTNVIHRPTARGGKGINLVGHHEIMLPLIAAGVIEQLG